MPLTQNTHIQASPGVELRGFGWREVADITTEPAGNAGEIVDSLGVLYYWDGTNSRWVVWYQVTLPIPASEALAAGQFVQIWSDAGVAKVRRADGALAREADGFVLAAVASGATASVYPFGANTALTGLTPGATYWLGLTGAVTTTPPAADGEIAQYLGKAVSATELHVALGDPLEITNSTALPTVDPHSGTTAARPTSPALGRSYFDTTLGYRVDWNGAAWVPSSQGGGVSQAFGNATVGPYVIAHGQGTANLLVEVVETSNNAQVAVDVTWDATNITISPVAAIAANAYTVRAKVV